MDINSAYFILDRVEDAIILITCGDVPKIEFANRTFLESTSSTLFGATKNVDCWEELSRVAKESMLSKQVLEHKISLRHPKNGATMWEGRLYPVLEKSEVCCIFKRMKTGAGKMHYWHLLNNTGGIRAVWTEYDRELDDMKYLHVTASVCKSLGKTFENIIGRYSKRDLKLPAEEVDERLAIMKKAEKEMQEGLICCTLPCGTVHGRSKFFLTGYSDDAKKNPQFIILVQESLEEYKQFKNLEKELKEKQKEYQALEFEISVLQKFVDVAPPIAVVDLVNDDNDIRIVSANPAYASFANKTLKDMTSKTAGEMGFDSERIRNWNKKVRQSQLLNQPISFEYEVARLGEGIYFENLHQFQCILWLHFIYLETVFVSLQPT